MSAPDTDLEKQKSRHRGPLAGMGFAVVFAGVLLVALVVYLAVKSDPDEGEQATVDGRTGAVETTD